MKIVVTGGGSGGHAIPALTIAQELRKRGDEVVVLGSRYGIERELFLENGFSYREIKVGKLRRGFTFKNILLNLRDIPYIFFGIISSFFILYSEKPDVLFGTGGFVSIPPVIAAWILRKRIFMHEQTISVGLANKIASKFAEEIFLTYPDSARFFKCKTEVTGMPVRDELINCKNKVSEYFSIDKKRPLIFITGGAQGSQKINEITLEILPKLLEKYNVIHQYGQKLKLADDIKSSYYFKGSFFKKELPSIMNSADLLIGRSGAGTVMDCGVTKTPAIFIPLPHATMDEQTKNGEFLSKLGGAIIIKERELTGEKLLELINELFEKKKIEEMKKKLSNIENINGTDKIISRLRSNK